MGWWIYVEGGDGGRVLKFQVLLSSFNHIFIIFCFVLFKSPLYVTCIEDCKLYI